ncbi:MAG: hypothetical protein HOD97_06065 [Candidatus Marinimicrobia bacterium]|jgi:protein involved in polysaccharide export with SLBB domain|nr:hypothetical protein [Candidatus Neomarinimicrobiota bacterium]MBT3618528.1 hypothetical protein [Candidatus Neomarinimicrobiota bacterium]MBT3828934.1 hypothetical protein [Candidatus Neomarinimicrobiota bacterium]MBT3997318.1 hypothetical protein [Candidatus Neomarinimicrobiota bacterium]MBT4281160.1 hypothetical protein [Candidatus Neomarinimicrobiota bacterium]
MTYKYIKFILIGFIFFISKSNAQDDNNYKGTIDPKKYGWQEDLDEENQLQNQVDYEYISLEKAIDPNTYILGPGDVLGINIISSKSMSYSLRILPSGDILIPTVGSLSLHGKTLQTSIQIIHSYIQKNAFPNSKISISLENIKRFKVQISGAVHIPGFIEVTGVSRLLDAVELAGGVQKYAKSNLITVIRDGNSSQYHPGKFLITGDLKHNPVLKEKDIIHVSFDRNFDTENEDLSDYNLSQVLVIGFVQVPGGFRHIPGYKVRDYIALRGGPTESGSLTGARVVRKDGTVLSGALNESVYPGDIIEVPATFQYRLFGKTSATQIISAFLSIYLAYEATLR